MEPIPETAVRARQDYIDGKPIRTILAETKFSLTKFYHWLDGAPQAGGATLLPPIPRRLIITGRKKRAATRLAMVERPMRAIDIQIQSLEQRMAQAGYQAAPKMRA